VELLRFVALKAWRDRVGHMRRHVRRSDRALGDRLERSIALPMKRIALTMMLIACKSADARCAHCGMKIDPASPFLAELDGRKFDTPRCALIEWVSGGKRGTVSVQDYYDRAKHPASDVRFVTGSDVVGPMGAELVPVDESRVAKFEKDHGGTRALALADIDEKALQP
jgi:hypothetical protein